MAKYPKILFQGAFLRDNAQIRLKLFCGCLNENGVNFMLSNSDCLGKDGTDRFFDEVFRNLVLKWRIIFYT